MDWYSRWVAFFKVLLPLAALGLLSTLFLLSEKVDPDASIPFADREIADRLRDQQITAPTYSGTSARGEDIFISAVTVSPPIDGKPAHAKVIDARLVGKRGRTIQMQAEEGTLADTVGRATLSGNVVIKTSTGYVLRTDLLTAELDRSAAKSPGPVTGDGPLGEFEAGAMEMSAENEPGTLHIVFKNGVRLLYDPKQLEE